MLNSFMNLWIAMDIDGILCLFKNKPVCCDSGMWHVPFEGGLDPQNIILDKNTFTEVTFENSPIEVKLMLNNGN